MAKKGLLCVYCHDDIRQLLTHAHRYHKKERRADPNRRGINEAENLCWSCHHGLLHQSIISWEEVTEAADATRAGARRVTHDQVYRQIAAGRAGSIGIQVPQYKGRHVTSRKLRYNASCSGFALFGPVRTTLTR